jgi:hypothetical protein
MPSGAGLAQQRSACEKYGRKEFGVQCGLEENNLFATGMIGDEDLGEDILMRGAQYRFL